MRGSSLLIACSALLSSMFTAFADCQPSEDVLASLKCLDGVKVEEVKSTVANYRQFEITIKQDVDHQNPGKESFEQRLVLLHKGWDEPLVLQTSGYEIFSVALSRLATTFGANQIQIEHRYFANSTPQSKDWSKLNIEQSAADFHHITEVFKQLYKKKWVGTGASKGGMTSTYHRYFYPNDLDGTVADVAPLSFSLDDPRYVTFVDEVGGGKYTECRAKLYELQHTLVSRRDELVKSIEGEFTQLGSAAVGFEHAVIEMPFVFWQYGNPEDPSVGCQSIPASNASDKSLLDFLNTVNEVSGYGDEGFKTFAAYYYQSGTQLGAPGSKIDHISDVKKYDYNMAQYMPKGVEYTYSNEEMVKVENWVKNEAHSVMFVYGEYDPWSGGAYPVDAAAKERDVHKFVAPKGNHSSKIHLLASDDKKAALEVLSRWFDKKPVVIPVPESFKMTLDDLEMKARRRWRLP